MDDKLKDQILSTIKGSIQSKHSEEDTYTNILTKLKIKPSSSKHNQALRHKIAEQFQRFKSGIACWSTINMCSFKLLNERYAIGLEMNEKGVCSLMLFDNFCGKQR